MNKHLVIFNIRQKDNTSFAIEWSDGAIQEFRLSTLQRLCPCAKCVDETTGKPLLDPATVDENVRAISLRSVGRYGLQIKFTSGCSFGIYSFETLRRMKS